MAKNRFFFFFFFSWWNIYFITTVLSDKESLLIKFKVFMSGVILVVRVKL